MTSARRTGTASAAALSGLALALGLSHAVAPEWARRAGLDVWNMPGVRAAYQSATAEREALDAGHEQFSREVEVGEHLAGRVVAGTVPLAAAAAEMEPLLRHRAGFVSTCETHYRTPNLRLGAARYLIIKVGTITEGEHPFVRAVTLARLEAEFAAMR